VRACARTYVRAHARTHARARAQAECMHACACGARTQGVRGPGVPEPWPGWMDARRRSGWRCVGRWAQRLAVHRLAVRRSVGAAVGGAPGGKALKTPWADPGPIRAAYSGVGNKITIPFSKAQGLGKREKSPTREFAFDRKPFSSQKVKPGFLWRTLRSKLDFPTISPKTQNDLDPKNCFSKRTNSFCGRTGIEPSTIV